MKSKKMIMVSAAIVLLAGALITAKLRSSGFSARAKPTAIEIWLARRARDLATPRRVKKLMNPIVPNPLIIAEARDHFADHCAQCHGNSGDGKTMLGRGMYPPPPDLRAGETQSLSDGEIFNIIKEGIRFTGMPGFGGSDADNWKLVAFIRHLPKLSDKEAEFMREINGIPDGASHEGQ